MAKKKIKILHLQKKMKSLIILFFILLNVVTIYAQSDANDDDNIKPISLSSGIEGNILQFATVTSGNVSYQTIPRYSYFFNMGADVDIRLLSNLKVFTGFHIKNIGMITKITDSIKIKERVYTFGAPIGLKWQDNKLKLVLKVGIDAALAINYKIKHFVNDKKIFKDNKFFSDDANLLFTSIFGGVAFKGFSVTANYYLNNFYNPNKTSSEAKLFTISFGFNFDNSMMKFTTPKKSANKTASLN